MKKTYIWLVTAVLALIGQLNYFFFMSDTVNDFTETSTGQMQLILIIAAIINVYIAHAVSRNFDYIESELNELKNPKKEIQKTPTKKSGKPIGKQIRERRKDDE